MRRNVIAPVAVGLVALAGCTGSMSPPSGVPSKGVACPTISPLARTGCPGLSIESPNLTCGGDGKMTVASSTITGGGTRFFVQVPNGSVFTGTSYRINAICEPGLPHQTGAKLGVMYTGDLETETEANGITRPCIVRSKAEFTQFETQDPLLSYVVLAFKDGVHQAIDDAVINQVFVTPGSSSLPGRCARF